MNDHSTTTSYKQILESFEKCHFDYMDIELKNDYRILASPIGARVFGPFKGIEGESILWTNPVISSPISLKNYINKGGWNIGGDRIWISPEIQYNCRDRSNFFGTVFVSREEDPGNYKLIRGKNECSLRGFMNLKAFNLKEGYKELMVDVKIKQCKNPLIHSNVLADKISFTGYEQEIVLSEISTNNIMSAIWNITQVIPGGTMYLSLLPHAEIIDYFKTASDIIAKPNKGSFKITGDRMFKIGFKSFSINGRYAYLFGNTENDSYLIVKIFFNNPSAMYLDEPPSEPGSNGCSIFIFNSSKEFGGFGEMECVSQPIGGDSKKKSIELSIQTWIFQGAARELKNILELLVR